MKSRFAVQIDKLFEPPNSLVASKCFPGYPIQEAAFLQDNCFQNHLNVDMSKMVFIANGKRRSFGKMNAREFVSRFKRQFELAKGKQKAEKLQVTDIYFIDTDSTVRPKRRISFAQAVVDKLHAAGFKKVVVHRIEKPAKCKKDQFKTSVNVASGHIFSSIENISQTTLHFAFDADPKKELDKPQNLFIRGENKATKIKRIARELIKSQSKEQIKAIENLRTFVFKSNDKPQEARIIRKKLKTIVHQLELANNNVWTEVLFNARDHYLKNHTNIGPTSVLPGSQIHTFINSILEENMNPDSQARNDNIHGLSPTMIEFKERIRALIYLLSREISGLQKGWMNFFHCYEIETKERKLRALEKLYSENNFIKLRDTAREFAKDIRVMRSSKRSFTSDLLNDIVNSPPAAGIDPNSLDSPILRKPM